MTHLGVPTGAKQYTPNGDIMTSYLLVSVVPTDSFPPTQNSRSTNWTSVVVVLCLGISTAAI